MPGSVLRLTHRFAAGAVSVAVLTACTPEAPGGDDAATVPATGGGPEIVDGLTVLDPLVDRAAHTASLLPDGRVLVVGGCVVDGCSDATAATEVYDPASGRFAAAAELAAPRDGHTATVLPNGDVLVIGGYTGEGRPPLATAELYVAATGRFEAAGVMSVGRGAHTAALLPDGRVLVVGGWTGPRTFSDSSEIWDPASRGFTAAGELSTPRGGATATTLPDGRVLVVGGEDEPAHGLATTEIYDPASARWQAGPSLAQPRFKHAAVALDSGDVFVIGGTTDDENLLSAVERFDGASFRPAGTLLEGRYKLSDAVVPLADGRILVAGGGQSAEAYDPRTQKSLGIAASTNGSRSSFTTATVLPDATVLIVGGYDDRIELRRDAYLLATV